jgi:HPt (histidine-containing phosphotransfer) domain-containing protein
MEASSNGENNSQYSIIDLQYLYDLADGSFDFVEEMIQLFLNSVPQSVEELQTAIANSEWQKVKVIAHRIKPSFGFIGAKEVQERLGQMERNAIEMPDIVFQKKMYEKVAESTKICVEELQSVLANNSQ